MNDTVYTVEVRTPSRELAMDIVETASLPEHADSARVSVSAKPDDGIRFPPLRVLADALEQIKNSDGEVGWETLLNLIK